MSKFQGLITQWHHDRNLIEGSSDLAQATKLVEEFEEFMVELKAGNVEAMKDEMGDILTVLINHAERNGFGLEDALETAWHKIKHRNGLMIDGVFVKETDVHYVPSIDTYVNLKVYEGVME